MVYDPQSGGTGGLHAFPTCCVAPKQLPSGGLGPFPAWVGVWGRGQPLPHVVTQVDSVTQGVSRSPGSRLPDNSVPWSPWQQSRPPVSRETKPSASWLLQQRLWVQSANSEGQLGVQDRGARCCRGVGPVHKRRSRPGQGPGGESRATEPLLSLGSCAPARDEFCLQ